MWGGGPGSCMGIPGMPGPGAPLIPGAPASPGSCMGMPAMPGPGAPLIMGNPMGPPGPIPGSAIPIFCGMPAVSVA